MGVYYSLDGGEPNDLASNSGYGDLCRWVDSLGGRYPELAHIRNYGWEQDLHAAESQLARALSESPPRRADVMATARGLLAVLKGRGGAGVLTVNNGIVKGDDHARESYAPLEDGDEPGDAYTLAEWESIREAAARREKGEKFQGPSGRWFVVNDQGRTVPTASPAGKAKPAPKATPKPETKPKAEPAKKAPAKKAADPALVAPPEVAREDRVAFQDLVAKSASVGSEGKGGRANGMIDKSAAQSIVALQRLIQNGETPHSIGDVAKLAADQAGPGYYPDEKSHAIANKVAAQALELIPDSALADRDTLRRYFPAYSPPPGKVEGGTYPASLDLAFPAQAGFLRDRLGATPAGPASEPAAKITPKAGPKKKAAPAPAPLAAHIADALAKADPKTLAKVAKLLGITPEPTSKVRPRAKTTKVS